MDPNIQPQQPSVQSVQPIETPIPPEPQKSFSRFKWILISIVAILLLSSITYLAIQQLQHNQTIPQITQNIPSPTPDETANWETFTYTNRNFGNYKLKYPKGWVVKFNIPDAEVDYDPFTCCVSIYNPKDSDNSLSISVTKEFLRSKQEFFNPEDNYWLIKSENDPKKRISPPTQTTVDGRKAMKQIYRRYPGTKIAISYGVWMEGDIDHEIVGITFVYEENSPNKEELIKTFDKILSTFKFLEQTSPSLDDRIKDLVINFYQAFENEDGKMVFSLMTPPQSVQEEREHSWLTGVDLGKDAFYRSFLRVKLQNPIIKSVKKLNDKIYEIAVTDEFLSYSQAAGQWNKILREVKFHVVNTSSGLLIDRFTWDGNIGSYKASPKYSGFSNVESN